MTKKYFYLISDPKPFVVLFRSVKDHVRLDKKQQTHNLSLSLIV